MLPASNMAVYSTKIGNYGKGVFMSYAQIMQGVARILGPLLAGASLHYATHWALFAVLGVVFSLGPICFTSVWELFHTQGKWGDEALPQDTKTQTARGPRSLTPNTSGRHVGTHVIQSARKVGAADTGE